MSNAWKHLTSIESRPAGAAPDAPAANTAAEPSAPAAVAPHTRRSAALTGLLVLAIFYTLYFARALLLPIIFAMLLNLVLVPVLRGLKRLHIPEAVGAAIILTGLVVAVGCGLYLLSQPASDWMQRAPSVLGQLEGKISFLKQPVREVSQATQRVEHLTTVEAGPTAPKVELKPPSLGSSILTLTRDFLAQAFVTLVLLYFLLASGDLFLRKVIRVLATLEDKKLAVEIARRMQQDMSAYLLTVTGINCCLGAVVAVIMFAIGMPNPVLWGVVAGSLNFIPYIGPAVSAAIIAVVGILSFGTLAHALLAPGAFLALATLEGNFITPYVLGLQLTLNPVAIIIGLAFWGWLWGVFGALIAVPTLVVTKIFCDHIEPLAPVGEFLGR